ncbi:MAG TPA: hypothetical protein VKC53_02675 [Patescibacteria group bacterium]|nr:hypothetical protein [Patescibacteria group bacterium]
MERKVVRKSSRLSISQSEFASQTGVTVNFLTQLVDAGLVTPDYKTNNVNNYGDGYRTSQLWKVKEAKKIKDKHKNWTAEDITFLVPKMKPSRY